MKSIEDISIGSNHQQGFTIVEMIVTIAIIAIAAAIAVPSISRWNAKARLDGAARNLLFNFQHAKMQAAKRSNYCTITFNLPVDGNTYEYVIFEDSDQDLEHDDGEEILRKIKFSEVSEYRGVSLDTSEGGGDGLSFADNDNGRPSVAFNSRGLSINNTGGSGAGTVHMKNNINEKKQIQVSTAGRVRIQ
jgi:prepilin-type N-terminal cleavage/methylation domain-containing protein